MPEENPNDKFEWRDVLAMIIAAFQVVLPYVVAMAVLCLVLIGVLKLIAH